MSAEVAVREDIAALEQLDTAAREVAVTHALTDARNRLAFALQATGPETVAAIKAEVGAIADWSKRVGLSKEIRDDAIEVLRRAEYALARAIRRGQEDGTVSRKGTPGPGRGKTVVPSTTVSSPSDFASDVELYDRPSQGKAGILSLADSATPEQFDDAIAEARAEGNLSRANVSRKLNPAPEPRPSGERHELLKRTRRVDSNLIVAGTVEAAAVPASTLELVNYADLDRDNLGEWISSLSESIRTLRALRSRLEKELHREQV